MDKLKILTLDVVVNSGVMEPELIPYDYLGFHKKKTTVKGLVSRCEYYLNFDGVEYSDLIVEVIYSYSFNGVVYTASTTTVNWIRLDESIGHSKTFTKNFMPWEVVDFGMTKRNNILSTTKIYVIGAIGVNNGYDLLSSCATEMTAYVEGPFQPLIAKINSLVGVKPYLTQQLADNINSILTDI
jgi:hypothetical protein